MFAPRSLIRLTKSGSLTPACSAAVSLSTTVLGVAFGAYSPYQTPTSKFFSPSSCSYEALVEDIPQSMVALRANLLELVPQVADIVTGKWKPQ